MRDAHLVLMDIDAAGCARTEGHVRRIVAAHGLPARVTATTDRRAALTGADFVVVCFQVGGVDAYAIDIEIPQRYGIDQAVGDTLGPGGIFRGLRSMHALAPIAADMREVCPDALLLQYANPMAINCWFTSGEGVRTVGLCHSVQHTVGAARRTSSASTMRNGRSAPPASTTSRGCWRYRRDGRDVLPELRDGGAGVRPRRGRERRATPTTRTRATASSCAPRSWTSPATSRPSRATTRRSTCRTSAARRQLTADYIANRWDYIDIGREHDDAQQAAQAELLVAEPLAASEEYAAVIVGLHAHRTRRA